MGAIGGPLYREPAPACVPEGMPKPFYGGCVALPSIKFVSNE